MGNAVGVIDDVIASFNQKYNSTLNLGIQTRYWKKSSYPQSGGNPQELLNKQFVEDCDLAVAIFKTRFGTPTDKYGSGSEEEIEIMLNAGRQVFLYFDDSPVSPSDIDADQYKKIKEFEKKYQTLGLYSSYKSLEEFRKLFDAHITQYFMTLEKVNEITSRKPELKVCVINDGNIEQDAILQPFTLGRYGKSEDIIDQIKEKFDSIQQYKVDHSISGFENFFMKAVVIEDDTKVFINKWAESLGIDIESSFYDLGNLKENIANIGLIGGNSLNGSDSEIEKYNSILELRGLFYKLFGHIEMEKYYSTLRGVQLILCNEGTTFDEDIEVVLRLSKKNVILPSELKVPNHEVDRNEDWCFEDIFEIEATKDFISHTDSKKRKEFVSVQNYTPILPFQSIDYEEEYRETLTDIFDYKYYEDDEYEIIMCHFDYIKQHQKIAFPTWLFLKQNNSETKILYEITSKNVADVLTGEICVHNKL